MSHYIKPEDRKKIPKPSEDLSYIHVRKTRAIINPVVHRPVAEKESNLLPIIIGVSFVTYLLLLYYYGVPIHRLRV